MKENHPCAIVIPIYKEQIDKYEELSFRQCMKILHRYQIFLVTHKHLNLSVYENMADEYHIQLKKVFFSDTYFSGIAGYNELLKSKKFYSAFDSFQYMLIYQLDAFVFRDELEYWCRQGFDYIGAPWTANLKGELLDKELWRVGNGGFSLRKVSYFLKVLSWRGPLLTYRNYKKIWHLPFILGWKNNIRYFSNLDMNEDVFFTIFMNDSYFRPQLPSPQKAALFSFEKYPSYLYKECNNHLPFGCHAFLKNDFSQFWKQYIESI